eukprot:PhF_6_TR17425/c0_g1_i3/m.26669/K07918/RAB32; Ras-related protein Rab-32
MEGGEPNDLLLKILVIGESSCGKTSLIRRYVHGIFQASVKGTIGVDFALKVVSWEQRRNITLQVWDIAGQERYGQMTRVYYQAAVGALVVYDVSRASTFDAVTKWKEDVDSKVHMADGQPIPCVLVGNKCDLPPDGTRTKEFMDQYCRQHNFVSCFETSAKDETNVAAAFQALIAAILQRFSSMGSPTVVPKPISNNTTQPKLTEKAPKKEKGKCC